MNKLRDGAVIHIYKTGVEIKAFISGRKIGLHHLNLRITTVMALQGKNLIKQTTKVYASDWEGIWAINE